MLSFLDRRWLEEEDGEAAERPSVHVAVGAHGGGQRPLEIVAGRRGCMARVACTVVG
jgi:hypothetical protein